jgi:hypothetical protein
MVLILLILHVLEVDFLKRQRRFLGVAVLGTAAPNVVWTPLQSDQSHVLDSA